MASSEKPVPKPEIYSIGCGRPFADDLAAGLLQLYPDQVQLARVLLLLPNRRSVRALSDAFVRHSEGRALLLPRMTPLADMEMDEAPGGYVDGLAEDPDMSPVDPLARQLLLGKLLGQMTRSPAEAFLLAGQLGTALDTLVIEGLTAADLAGIDPGAGLQEHWQRNRDIMATVLDLLPDVLAARGVVDPTARRVRLMQELARRWRQEPPPFPVFAVGMQQAPAPLARLLGVIARMPEGRLALPGFDAGIDAEEWRLILGTEGARPLETHPQYGMARMLVEMGVAPMEVTDWPWRSALAEASAPERGRMLGRAMVPPELSAEVHLRGAPPAQATDGLRMLETDTPVEEALAIAIALRQVTERPGATAALVTPDRDLARRVGVQLSRFGIDVDDSAGRPLSALAPGALLLLLAEAAAERMAPVALLSLLKHPLVRSGEARLGWLDEVRRLDRLALRGLRPAPGLAGVAHRLDFLMTDEGRADNRLSARDADDVALAARWWAEEVQPMLAPLETMGGDAAATLTTLREVAEALAGAELWQGDAGRALATLIETLGANAETLAAIPLSRQQAPEFLRGMLDMVSVRAVWRQHPQIVIWGPLEARLQSADLIILGGLNEGVWPPSPAPDPFLAPAIRRILDLPGLPRRTGLSAHDFIVAASSPHVLLTRSIREGSAPSIPSRFWQRLRVLAGDMSGGASDDLLPEPEALLAATRSLLRAERDVPMEKPAPNPPVSERPRTLNVTDVAALRADPFSIYAKQMLGLRPLDPLDDEPGGALRGTVVHRILERLVKEGAPDPEALIEEELRRFSDRPELSVLWKPRVRRMVAFVAQRIAEDPAYRPFAVESRGEMEIAGVKLRGRADRIDIGESGYRIVDYKTGEPPPPGDVAKLWDMQLPLLAMMLEAGVFNEVPPDAVNALEYWQVSGGANVGKARPSLGVRSQISLEEHRGEAEAELLRLIRTYYLSPEPFLPKLHPVHGRRWRDFDHLSRLAEWLDR